MKRKIRWLPIVLMLLAAAFVDLSRQSLPGWLVTVLAIIWVFIVVVGVYRMVTPKR